MKNGMMWAVVLLLYCWCNAYGIVTAGDDITEIETSRRLILGPLCRFRQSVAALTSGSVGLEVVESARAELWLHDWSERNGSSATPSCPPLHLSSSVVWVNDGR